MSVLDTIKKDLLELGIKADFKTQPEFWSWLRRVGILYSPPALKLLKGPERWTTPVGTQYSEFQPAMKGSYGNLILASREVSPLEDSTYCFLKTSDTHSSTLLVEGILQTLARSVLTHSGFSNAIPRVLDICQHPSKGIVLALERIHGSKMLGEYLSSTLKWGVQCEFNDQILLSIIAQVASYMAVLETELGMNHRDLKGSNVLMIVPLEQPILTVSTLDAYQWSIQSRHQTILIDFGFSCIGRPSGETVISAGEFLPETDFCPKEGRDLFLFLASLWSLETLRSSLTSKAILLFSDWLQDNQQKTSWTDWLETNTQDGLLSMYLLTSSSGFGSSTCAPLSIIRGIAAAYPEICQFTTVKRPATPVV